MDWNGWHDEYDRPGSRLARRLAVVQERVRAALDAAPGGPVRVISMCAGQGRDVIPVLAGHPRRADVRARLVELDPRNCEVARAAAAAHGLDQVEVVAGDAALTGGYAGLAPAGLVLACGIFGNVTDEDVRRTIGFFPRLCASGGRVIWTRHREEPDLVPRMCGWFEEDGFELEWVSEPGAGYGVGVHRFTGTPLPLEGTERMFRFVGYDRLR
ncbi:class I SAM-dependent methyltransferase family protein [Actinomadura sp. ATCC 31491]|uniref:Class I SAM-dependent methyltransferase family protein n=1 Tax=Actinomadura luzonensis TaxID=2805427 RepID=A0ABT0G8U0_9ACTN|nr:class I SAM-dependent methyltransferase family protein [Actinomadura luzonensis]MCK2221020.1 class I SAM-dependent methyltransferase family protein [Actinomadura luzonensis]